MAKSLIYVRGTKGGVGTSATTKMIVDYFLRIAARLVVVDADTSADIFDTFTPGGQIVDVLTINLDRADGWFDLADVCEEYEDATVVVSQGARSEEGMKNFWRDLEPLLRQRATAITFVFVIAAVEESAIALQKLLQVLPAMRVVVAKSVKDGVEDFDDFYEGTTLKDEVEKRGGCDFVIPFYYNELRALFDGPFGENLDRRANLNDAAEANDRAMRIGVRNLRAAIDKALQGVLE
jgi:hypothetical protein